MDSIRGDKNKREKEEKHRKVPSKILEKHMNPMEGQKQKREGKSRKKREHEQNKMRKSKRSPSTEVVDLASFSLSS